MNLQDLQNRIAGLVNQAGQTVHNFIAPPQQPQLPQLSQHVNTQNIPYSPYQNPQTGIGNQSAQLKFGQNLPPVKIAQNTFNLIKGIPQSIAAGIVNPPIQAINKTLTQTNQALQQNKGNPIGGALQATGQLAKNTVINPSLLSEAAAFGVPFGKGANFLTKSVLPGAVSGGIYQAGQPGANPQNIAESALLGGATAGALHGAGVLLKNHPVGLTIQDVSQGKPRVDFSQQPTHTTDNLLADAEHHLKYNVALQAAQGLNPSEATRVKSLIYNTDVADATNPMEMVNMIYRNLPPDLQKNPGVLDAIKNYGSTAQQVFQDRIRGAEKAPAMDQSNTTLNQQIPGMNDQIANYKPPKVNTPSDIVQNGNNLEPLGNQPEQTAPLGAKERGFVTTVKESPNAPQQLKDLVSGTYNVKANKVLLSQANTRITKDPVAATQFATTQNTDEATATAIQLVKQLSMQGNHQAAADIVNTKAEQLTEAGRTIQAASLFDSLSPEGVAQLAARTIQNYNAKAGIKIPELTGQQLKLFTDEATAIKQLPIGREQDMARQKLLQSIGRLLPSSAINQGLGIWRAGLLTGPQTVTKIVTSHAAMLALERIKDIPTTMADSVASLLTGKRSMTPTLQGTGSGAKQGTIDAFDNLLKGYEAPNSGGFAHDFKNTVNYGNSFLGKVAQAYVDGVGRLHGSLYKPFYGAAHLNSLYDQALTEAGNNGLTGEAKNNFVLNFVKNATPEALKVANRDASYATFQQKTMLGSAASGLQRNLGPIGKIIAPFTRIPSAIITDAVDYTPVGIAKSIIQTINRGQFTTDSQRQLVQGIGRGVTGTSLIAIGAALYNKGLINLDRPQNAKEAAQWDLEGRKQQSIKVDGQWKNLAALGPLGHVLGIGGYFQQGLANSGLPEALGSSAMGTARITLDQPYLTQVSDISQAVQSPQQKGLTEAKSLASSVIPTLSGTVARAIDPLQRQTNTVLDAMQNKIPLVRQGLLPKTNALGQNMQRSGGVLQNLLDPFQSYTDTSGQATNNPVVSELGRLDALGLSATPAKLTANQTIQGIKEKLTPAQLTTLNQAEGARIQQSLFSLFQSTDYQKLTDEEKQNAINSTVTAIRKQVRGTIDLSNSQSSAGSNGQQSANNLQFTIINPATGGVRQIDLGTSIVSPSITGNTNLDKKLTVKYNSDLSSRANDIVLAYQNNKIDAATAEQMLQDIVNQKIGAPRKSPKITIAKPPNRRITLGKTRFHKPQLFAGLKIKQPKVATKARISKNAQLKVPKASFAYKIASPVDNVFSTRRKRYRLSLGQTLV